MVANRSFQKQTSMNYYFAPLKYYANKVLVAAMTWYYTYTTGAHHPTRFAMYEMDRVAVIMEDQRLSIDDMTLVIALYQAAGNWEGSTHHWLWREFDLFTDRHYNYLFQHLGAQGHCEYIADRDTRFAIVGFEHCLDDLYLRQLQHRQNFEACYASSGACLFGEGLHNSMHTHGNTEPLVAHNSYVAYVINLYHDAQTNCPSRVHVIPETPLAETLGYMRRASATEWIGPRGWHVEYTGTCESTWYTVGLAQHMNQIRAFLEQHHYEVPQ